MEFGDLFATVAVLGGFLIALFIKIWRLKEFTLWQRISFATISSASTAILFVAIVRLLQRADNANAGVWYSISLIILPIIDGLLLSILVERGLRTIDSLEKYVIVSLIAYFAAFFLAYAGGMVFFVALSL